MDKRKNNNCIEDIKSLIDDYVNWFRSELSLKNIGDYKILSTPFLDKNNDKIQVYISVDGDNIKISDDSWIINNLEMSNIQIIGKRKEEVEKICLQNGLKLEDSEFIINANKKNYPQLVHRFIQSLLEIDDMYLTSRNRVTSLFFEDVREYFDQNEIFYSPNIQIVGISSFSNKFDFMFQKNKTNPERLCKLINKATKQKVGDYIFIWEDTFSNRSENTEFIVVINDEDSVPDSYIDAFSAYGIKAIKWSKISENRELFV